MNLRTQLERFEGRKYEAYPDVLTGGDPWTIGVGHTGPEVHEGLVWTDQQIDDALDSDIAEAELEARRNLSWFDTLEEPRRAVIAGMFFQLKHPMAFSPTYNLVRDERYADAAEHLRQSDWAKQTHSRVMLLAHQLETGAWA